MEYKNVGNGPHDSTENRAKQNHMHISCDPLQTYKVLSLPGKVKHGVEYKINITPPQVISQYLDVNPIIKRSYDKYLLSIMIAVIFDYHVYINV